MKKTLFYGDNLQVLKDHIKDAVEREKSAMGLFITLEEPTKPMLEEAVQGGFYNGVSKIQIITIKELLQGKLPSIPSNQIDYKKQAQEDILNKQKGFF